MNCQDIQRLIHAHHDGELDTAHTLEFEHHLADCPACFTKVRNLNGISVLVRSEALRYQAPAALRQSIRTALSDAARAEQSAPAPGRSRWREALGVAAIVVIAATLALQWRLPGREDPLLAELTSSHVRSLMVTHLTDVTSTDQHTVKPWFDGKLDFAPPVIDFKEAGFPLSGGRMDYIANRPVAALVYGRNKHWINLFIWPDASPDSASAAQSFERNGYHLVRWSHGGMKFWAVSDLNEKELREFAGLWSNH